MSVVDARIAAIAHGQHGVFALWQLAGTGVSPKAVRARHRDASLRRLFRGVYASGRYVPVRGQWMAATLARGPRALLSHGAAGALWELVEWRAGPVDVTVARGGSRPQAGLRPHVAASLRADDRKVVDGIPVTSVARTLLDLAAVLEAPRLRDAYEEAERHGVLDLFATRALLARSNGHRGVGALRSLLEYDPTLGARAERGLERLFLALLRRFGLPLPQVNVLVDGYLVDAFWPEANLVVELDSYEFHRDRATFERDREKLANLRAAGREALAFTYRQVSDSPDWVVGVVEAMLARGRAQPRGR